MFKSLQAGRGLAALAVVMFHIDTAIFGKDKYFPDEFWRPLSIGYSGVQFFFVLSGFIILHVHWRDLRQARKVGMFFAKRLIRIYPVYWVVLLGVMPILFWNGALGAQHPNDAAYLASSFLLWPTREDPFLGVAWTLKHEMLFYILFSTLLVSMRAGVIILGLWGAGCAAALVAGAATFPYSFLVSPNNLLFFFGMAVAWRIRTGRVPMPWGFAAGGLVGLVLSWAAALAWKLPGNQPATTMMFGLCSAILIAGLVELDRRKQIATPKCLEKLGDASYSLYLVHLPFMSGLVKGLFLLHIAQSAPHWVTFFLLLIGAVAVGFILNHFAEKPLLLRMQSWIGARDGAAAPQMSRGYVKL